MWISRFKMFQNVKKTRIIVSAPLKNVDNYVDNVDFIIFIMLINTELCKLKPV